MHDAAPITSDTCTCVTCICMHNIGRLAFSSIVSVAQAYTIVRSVLLFSGQWWQPILAESSATHITLACRHNKLRESLIYSHIENWRIRDSNFHLLLGVASEMYHLYHIYLYHIQSLQLNDCRVNNCSLMNGIA